MQRRIEETDGRRQAFQFAENADEIVALIRQQFGQRFFAVLGVVGQNHFAHGVNAVALKEHVFGAAEADAGGAEGDGVARLFRAVGVRAHLQARDLRAPFHQLREIFVRAAGLGLRVAFQQALDDFAVAVLTSPA